MEMGEPLMKKSRLARAAGCARSIALACSPAVLWTAPAYAESSDVEAYSSTSETPEKTLKEGEWDTTNIKVSADAALWNINLPESGDLYVSVNVTGKLWGNTACRLLTAGDFDTIFDKAYKKTDTGTVTFGPFKVSAGEYILETMPVFEHSDSSNAVSAKYYLDVPGKYTDVDSDTAHAEDVTWLGKSGVSDGWSESDGTRTFRPYTDIARADMAAFLYRLAGKPEYTAPATSPFKDVTSDTPHYEEICWLAEKGISQGWSVSGGKEFRPYDKVARCDMAAFLYRLAGSPSYAVSGSPFIDCGSKTPHYKEVCWLASTGVSAGWDVSGGREFRSYTKVARADMAAFLHRMKDKGLV